jgi:phospholipid/cholesterol/gamma-HCH transport system permease protein
VDALYAVQRLGDRCISFVTEIGGIVLLFLRTLGWLCRRPFRWRLIVRQMEFIGAGSFLIVFLTGSFTGLVLALQLLDAFSRFQAEGLAGATVSISMCRELGPGLTALIVTGRVGSAMATELGTMRVTEQIDALATMAVNPIQYLVVPRVLAGLVMIPILTMFFIVLSITGAEIVAVDISGVDPGLYSATIRSVLHDRDIVLGIVKSIVFGLTIPTVSCYKGYNATGGATGVGAATTDAVVSSFVAIFILDYIITAAYL